MWTERFEHVSAEGSVGVPLFREAAKLGLGHAKTMRSRFHLAVSRQTRDCRRAGLSIRNEYFPAACMQIRRRSRQHCPMYCCPTEVPLAETADHVNGSANPHYRLLVSGIGMRYHGKTIVGCASHGTMIISEAAAVTRIRPRTGHYPTVGP